MAIDRITIDPKVMGGKPCIRGMRVTVGTIVGMLAEGHTTAQILGLYPYLEAEYCSSSLLCRAALRRARDRTETGVKILIDMNLSPSWILVFREQNWEAHHWSSVGNPAATDSEILDWAKKNGYVVFTHDLDFGALLASRPHPAPSVIQLRGQETSPTKMGS